MSERRTANGKWVVIALVAVGLIAALAGTVFRRFPEEWQRTPAGAPATTTQATGPAGR